MAIYHSPLPKRLKEARLRTGLSQRELGIRAGMNEFVASTRMNQYENSVHTPTLQTAEYIAEQLGVASCYLYCVEDDVADLILAYSLLNNVEKKHALKSVREIKP